jgi:hypothetical protein
MHKCILFDGFVEVSLCGAPFVAESFVAESFVTESFVTESFF